MKKLGIYYGTTSGTTTGIVDELEFYLRKENYQVYNVKNGIEDLSTYENLILVSPTYKIGKLQQDWENILPELEKIDFNGKIVGLIGLGNQFSFSESFVSGLKILYDIVIKNGGKVIGFSSISDYQFEESNSIIDNKFVGLIIDEVNNGAKTPQKIKQWLDEIKPLFNY